MTEVLLSTDPLNGAFSTFDYDEGEDRIVIKRYWDEDHIKAILKRNAEDANHGTQRGDMRRAARIPDIVIYQWLNDFGVRIWDKNHQKKVAELLNSNEFYRLRANSGRL